MKEMKPTLMSSTRTRLSCLALIAGLGVLVVLVLASNYPRVPVTDAGAVVVYKRASCQCCTKWVTHLEQAGFRVRVHNVSDLSARQEKHGTPPALRACHTAMVGGYLVEGHVPAQDVSRLLTEKPMARGIAVPGMPIGSPGMEMGDRRDGYATQLIRLDGDLEIFAQHGG